MGKDFTVTTLTVKDFEDAVGKCTEASNLPGKKASLGDFDNFGLATACEKKLLLQQKNGRKLRSNVASMLVISKKITNVLSPMLEVEQFYDNIGEIEANYDKIIKNLTKPEVKELPECLVDVIINVEKTEKFTEDSEPKKTSKEAQTVLEALMKSFMENENKQLKEVEKYMSKINGLIADKADIELFDLIDKIIEYNSLIKSNKMVMDFYDSSTCIIDNCPQLAKDIFKDDFLWYDIEKTKFKLPIDIGSGTIKLFKMYIDICPEKKARAEIIETRYYAYVERKEKVLKEASDTIKKISPDIVNPFEDYLSKININNKVNILFRS